MSKILEFPSDKIAKGLHCYTPEMGQRKPNCQMMARLGHYGKHYYIDTPLTLKGRGITHLGQLKSSDLTSFGQYKVGWHQYKVTTNAFDKLKEQYSVSMDIPLD